jgi:peptidoglycan/xylan/chitin deacetylase (PgdA/CDA1 family)
MIRLLYSTLLLLLFQTAIAQKKVAVTFNGLPFVGADEDPKVVKDATNNLMKALKKHKIRSVGFVNEIFSLQTETLDDNIAILEKWGLHKHELGNHTFSHLSLNENSLEKYIEDIQKGIGYANDINNGYLNRPMRYFRHPYLQTGNDSTKKYGLEKYLKKDEYIPVSATMENGDWIFNHAYRKARDKGDLELQEYIGAEYIKYTIESIKYYDELGLKVFGSPIQHILLIHANDLNAKYLGKILEVFTAKGFEFIRVNEALKDPIYSLPDKFITEGGYIYTDRKRIAHGINTTVTRSEIPQRILELF